MTSDLVVTDELAPIWQSYHGMVDGAINTEVS